jgi:hypothetical protein
MKRCRSPLSPMACRAAVIRLVNVDSETMRPCQNPQGWKAPRPYIRIVAQPH